MTIRTRAGLGSRTRPGFSAVELLIVVVIIGILALMLAPRFTEVSAAQGAANSRDGFVWLAARARAHAVESGQQTRLVLDPVQRMAWTWLDGAVVDSLDFTNEDYMAHIRVEPELAELEICYTPRGVASLSCGTASTVVLRFTRTGRTSSARVWALGQVERL